MRPEAVLRTTRNNGPINTVKIGYQYGYLKWPTGTLMNR
jgi:hypothetical protein